MNNELSVRHVDGVTTLTITRPPLNLLTLSLVQSITRALEEARHRDATRAIVITGEGTRAFCAGADLNDLKEADAPAAEEFRQRGLRLVDLMEEHPKPIITAVRGWCIGGGTPIAWAGDLRIVAESARFRAGDVYLGMMPSWGLGNERLVHYIGRNRTLDAILLGEDISAQQAYEWGFATRVVSDEAFDAEVSRIASKVATAAPLAVQAIKQTVRAQYRDSPDRAKLLTTEWVTRLQESDDIREGMQAMLEKRLPVFVGR